MGQIWGPMKTQLAGRNNNVSRSELFTDLTRIHLKVNSNFIFTYIYPTHYSFIFVFFFIVLEMKCKASHMLAILSYTLRPCVSIFKSKDSRITQRKQNNSAERAPGLTIRSPQIYFWLFEQCCSSPCTTEQVSVPFKEKW